MAQLKPENFYDLKFISNINIVKDKIFFEIFTPDRKENSYNSSIYELKGKKALKYSRGKTDRDMIISPNNKLMIYFSKEDKKNNIILKDIENGNERSIYSTDLEIKTYKWDKNSKSIYLILQNKPKDEDYRIIDDYPVYFNGEGYIHNSEFILLQLYLSGRTKELWRGENNILEIEPSPNKEEIAVVVREKGWDVYDSKLAIFNTKERTFTYITQEKGGVSNLNFLKDGRLLFLFNSHKRSIFESPKFWIYYNRSITSISQEYDISISNSVNSDSRMGKNRTVKIVDDKIYFISTIRGKAGIYTIDLKGNIEKIVAGDFSVDGFDVSGNAIYFISQASDKPQEIWVKESSKFSKVTDINKTISSFKLTRPQYFSVQASDGKELDCWLMKGKNNSTILEIHGGPRTSYGEGFIFEFHLLNKMGFNVLYSNPRGSDSYGDDFALEIKGEYGERDFKDINEIVDETIKKFKIDSDSIGVNGGSYGGFMVNWIITHSERFKAAITDRSISDQFSFYFTSDIGPRFNGDQIGGNPVENYEHYIDKSPIKYYKNAKAPLLIIHSEEDFRCPISQAYEFYTAMKLNGNKVRMIVFKNENHDLSRNGRPRNRVKRLEEILGWFKENMADLKK